MDSRWIWPFELLDKLGEGGMGVVYRARYIGNDRQVAVKLIPEDITSNPTLLARFERELDVLTHLKHPNIVHCFGGSCKTKQRFYAMEFVTGGTLAQRLIDRGSLPWETAVDFAIQMCDALQYAHDHGVIHRDIKPGNFLITAAGQLKLSDFGLATVVSEGRLTAAGRTVGTILYMSPEQIRGGQITHSADLYGLGCVIYEMLVGRPPFSGENAADVLRKHLKEPPSHVVRLVPDCPLELDSLIHELLSKAPEQRPATAAAVAQRLNGMLLPSRSKNPAESEMFASLTTRTLTKTAPVVPRIQSAQSDSDDDIPATPRLKTRAQYLPWIIAGIACLMCLRPWLGWSHSASQLLRAEQSMVELLETADAPTKVLAAKELGKLDSLSPSTIEKLSRAAMLPMRDVCLASLTTLRQHAAEAQSAVDHLTKIQLTEDDPMVRAEVGRTLDAIQRMNSVFSPRSILFWAGVLVVIGAFGFCAKWIMIQIG